MKSDYLYVALVDTPGFFAYLIRKFIGINYIHVVLSLDPELQEAYSVGRRNPLIPFFAGFEKENLDSVKKAFPSAKYKVVAVSCTPVQKEEILQKLKKCYEERYRYHYCILGLLYLVAGRQFYQHNHYTCSSFTAKLLEECNVLSFSKHFSLVTPRDFYEYREGTVIYEGSIQELCRGYS